MNKFTLFTLFLSSIIVVIVAEIMVNEYLRSPYGLDGTTSLFHAQQAATQQVQPSSSQQNASGTASGAATGASTSTSPVSQHLAGSFTAAVFMKAGIHDLTLQNIPYDGKLFGKIPFADMTLVPTYQAHLAKNGVARIAGFYEFNPGSELSAKEFFDLIKQKCGAEVGVILNETNSYGDASFYVNYFEFPDKVFLVFRKGTRIFAFNYGKELHSSITKLAGLL
ncbi:MAG: hypothetical protein U0519_01170 [Candidatus Gracilibacteria bacterium]